MLFYTLELAEIKTMALNATGIAAERANTYEACGDAAAMLEQFQQVPAHSMGSN